MAKYTGWKKKYSYLDNYQKGPDGKYVYYGRHCIIEDDKVGIKRYRLISGIADILLLALFIAGGFMNGGYMWRCWYVLIPYMLEAVGVFIFLWKNLSFIIEKYPLKEYLHKKTVLWFKPVLVMTIVFGILSIIGTAVCMIVYGGTEDIRIPGCIMYLASKVLLCLVSLLTIKRLCGCKWILDPSEELE